MYNQYFSICRHVSTAQCNHTFVTNTFKGISFNSYQIIVENITNPDHMRLITSVINVYMLPIGFCKYHTATVFKLFSVNY